MNRKIKFRAWDGSKMIFPDTFTNGFGEFMPLVRCEDSTVHAYKPIPVMQFTGLIDDNVEEVYEGDIIFNEDRNEHGVVTWSKEKAMFVTEYPESKDAFPLWETLGNCYKVVGNIYENQGILKA